MEKRRVRRWAVLSTLALTLTLMVGVSPAGAVIIGNEGCTPGYWKNHTTNWEEYTPSTTLGSQFSALVGTSYANVTFLTALDYGGGTGLDGARRILLRAAVAAFLNAAHEGLGYPYRRDAEPGNLRIQINAALASNDRATMLALASFLDAANNLGCPLS